jgi:hypothetical protein
MLQKRAGQLAATNWLDEKGLTPFQE